MKSMIATMTGCVMASSLLFTAGSEHDEESRNSGRLPGARAEIDAARFPSIQAALDALPEQGGVVHLPPGTFEIEKPLRLSRGEVLLEGCGMATHIKNLNTEGQPALVVGQPQGSGAGQGERLWRIRLSDFRITGNEQSGHGVVADRINELFVDRLTVSEHGGDGLRLDHCYENPRITGCNVTYNKGTGLNLLGCHDIVVAASEFEENQDALRCIDGFNLCMTGNCLDDHLGNGVVIENTYGSVVAGNMIEECQGAAIILDRDCYGDTLSANVIAHNGAGIDLRDAHGCAVTGNTFTIMKSDALRIGPAAGRITVTGNNFSNSFIGEGQVRRGEDDRAAAGMTFEGATNAAVSGNLFSGLQSKALEVRGEPSRYILFADNALVDVESDHEKLRGSLVKDVLDNSSAPGRQEPK